MLASDDMLKRYHGSDHKSEFFFEKITSVTLVTLIML